MTQQPYIVLNKHESRDMKIVEVFLNPHDKE